MRIPPSVIVMSLVTAVPFALAVHDTMKPHPKTYDEMTDQEREAQFEEEMRKESAEQAERDAAETAKRAATYKTFFGEKPAQLGSYFHTVQLGMPVDQPAFDALSSTTDVSLLNFEGEKTLESIRISDERALRRAARPDGRRVAGRAGRHLPRPRDAISARASTSAR